MHTKRIPSGLWPFTTSLLSLRLHIHTCTHAYIYVYTCTHAYIYAYTCTQIHTQTYTHADVLSMHRRLMGLRILASNAHTHAHTQIHTHTCTSHADVPSMHRRLLGLWNRASNARLQFTRTHTHKCIHTYIDTYTHTHTNRYIHISHADVPSMHRRLLGLRNRTSNARKWRWITRFGGCNIFCQFYSHSWMDVATGCCGSFAGPFYRGGREWERQRCVCVLGMRKIYLCVYACTYIPIYIYTHTLNTHIHIYIYTYIHKANKLRNEKYKQNASIHTHNKHTHIHTYIHTHIHTYSEQATQRKIQTECKYVLSGSSSCSACTLWNFEQPVVPNQYDLSGMHVCMCVCMYGHVD